MIRLMLCCMVGCCRCIQSHGQQSTWLWTMWACGTSDQRTGHASTWASSSTFESTLLLIHGGTNIQSQEMLFSAAEPPVVELGHSDDDGENFCDERVTGSLHQHKKKKCY